MKHIQPHSPTILGREETLPQEELQAVQFVRIRECLRRIAEVPFYKRKFQESGFHWEDFRSLADITKLPFTTKSDLREGYPLGLLAVPREQIVRFHGSSGTTGKPTFVGYTANDLQLWSRLCARFLHAGA